jgi:tetratricopeptide (TPR) repeat protein
LARCLSDLGEPNKALAHYAQALAINPDLEDAYLGEAEIFRALNQPEKALEAANHARRVAPQSPRALAALGLANFRLGRHRQAHTQLADAAALLPDDAALQRAFALATYSIGNLDAARSGMAKLVDDHRPLAEEAREFLTLTDPLAPANRNAIALAEQRLAADPHDVPALMLHATREGQSPAQRAATYSQILKSFPEFDPARIALARLLMDDPRQLDAAESLAHAARQHRGDDPQVSAVLAIVSFRKGKYPQAAQLLTELAAARPLSPTELAALGVSQARTSRAADARLTLTAAIAAGLTGPDSALAAATLAELEEPER